MRVARKHAGDTVLGLRNPVGTMSPKSARRKNRILATDETRICTDEIVVAFPNPCASVKIGGWNVMVLRSCFEDRGLRCFCRFGAVSPKSVSPVRPWMRHAAEVPFLRKDVSYNSSLDISESEVAAAITIRKFLVIDSKGIKQRRMQIMDMNLVLGRIKSEVVRGSIAITGLHTAARKPPREGMGIVVASVASL